MRRKNLKYYRRQRVPINKTAAVMVPDYIGMYGHIGIGAIAAPHYFQRDTTSLFGCRPGRP